MKLKYNKEVIQEALSLFKEKLADKTKLPLKNKNWLEKLRVLSQLKRLSTSQPNSELKKEVNLFRSALKELEHKFKFEDLYDGNISLDDLDTIGRGDISDSKDLIDLQNMAYIIVSEAFDKNFVRSINVSSSIHDMWDVVTKLTDIIHHLESLDKMEVFEMVKLHEEQFSNDGLSSLLYRAFEHWAALCPNEAIHLINQLKQESSELSLSFLPRLIQGLGKVKTNTEIFQLIQDDITDMTNHLDRYLLTGLSHLSYSKKQGDKKVLRFVKDIVLKKGEADEPTTIRVWLNLLDTVPTSKKELLRIASQTDNPMSKHMFISALWTQEIYKSDFNFTKSILLQLKVVDPENLGTILKMSYLLDKLMEVNSKFATDLLLKWLSNPAWTNRQGEEFQQLLQKMSRNHPDALDEFMFHGLLNGSFPVQSQMLNICNSRNFQKEYIPKFPTLLLENCDDSQLEKLVRRTIGFVYDKDVLRSLLLSIILLKDISPSMRKFIKGLFLEYVCFNYSSTIEWFNRPFIQDNELLKKFCNEVSQAYDKYLNNIYDLPLLKELEPSQERMRLFNKIMSEQTEKAKQKSQANSFLSTVSKTDLRAGTKWVVKINGELGRIGSLSKIEVSSEFPRGECIDPIAMERIRIGNKFYSHEADT